MNFSNLPFTSPNSTPLSLHLTIFSVTKFTAQQDPTVLNLLGIAGDANRRKLAETFLRPTTWKDYCDLVSPNNCTTPDDVAQSAPTSEEDYERMFVDGSYTGHFRATDDNDCDANPDTCTGHVADFPCGWVSFVKPQTYYHNIALKSSGKEPHSHGYQYSQLVEMYAAANATRSNLMLMWWTPEATYSTYVGTEAEMQRVVLPTPTQECIDHRILSTQRCEFDDPMEQYGDPAGACDEAPQLLQKIVASGLYEATYGGSRGQMEAAKQSPAYDAIKAVKITEMQLGNILQNWINRGIDTYGFDPRLATCLWVRDNLDLMQDFIPKSHPRVGQEQNILESTLFYVAVCFGGLATILTILTSFFCYQRRNGYVMRFSQVEFLFLLLLGILLASIGSVLMAMEPTNATCMATTWLLNLGYTMEIVPLIVKVGAMNRLMTAAKKMKRIVLKREQLFGTVALFMAIILIFLILWSVLDPPQRQGEFHLTDNANEYGESIVTINYYCSSNSDIWRYAAVVWHCLLLLCATVLAFQTRNLQAGFSESTVLAIVIYSHFVFVLLRLISFVLEGFVSESYMAGLRSLVYSTDAIVTLCVYFIPKLLTDDQNFFNLTHQAQSGKSTTSVVDGRGSVLTMSGPGRSNNSGISGPRASSLPRGSNLTNGSRSAPYKNEEDEDSESSAMIHQPGEGEPVNTNGNKMSNTNTQRERDVLKDGKVSWGAACMTMIINDENDHYRDEQEDDEEEDDEFDKNMPEEAPFVKPVDVLKDGKDSWGGGHLTMLLQGDSEDEEEDGGRHGDEENPKPSKQKKDANKNSKSMPSITEVSISNTKKPVLAQPNLPANGPTRFNYALDRINRTREKFGSEIEPGSGSCSYDE